MSHQNAVMVNHLQPLSILDTDHTDITDNKTEYFSTHVPVSVSIASNIDGTGIWFSYARKTPTI